MKRTDELKNRVIKAKEALKKKGVERAKIEFFDEVYGMQYKANSIRLDNLWAGYITDEEFTHNLEKFLKSR